MNSAEVISGISKILNRGLAVSEIRFVNERITNAPKTINQEIFITETAQYIKNGSDVADLTAGMKEYLKTQIGTEEEESDAAKEKTNAALLQPSAPEINASVSSILKERYTSIYDIRDKIHLKSKEYSTYIVLDSFNVDPSLSTASRFVWNLNDGAPKYTTGTIDVPHKIHPIKKMRISEITFTNMNQTEYEKIYKSTGRRFCTHFSNFTQSTLPQTGYPYHFMHSYNKIPTLFTYRGSSPPLTPFRSGRGWYHFDTPHNKTDLIDMTVFDVFTPTDPIQVPDAYTTITGTQYSATMPSATYPDVPTPIHVAKEVQRMLNMQYTGIESTSTLADPVGPGITMEEVGISGFTTLDPGFDAFLIAQYNQPHILNLGFSDGLAYFDDGLFDGVLGDPVSIGYWEAAEDITGLVPRLPLTQVLTFTLPNKPRMIVKLELVSDLPAGETL